MLTLGVTAPPPGGYTRPGNIPPLTKKADVLIFKGPRLLLGPFNLPANSTSKFEISQDRFNRNLNLQRWIGIKLGAIADKYKGLQYSPQFGWMFKKKYKTWSVNKELPLNVWKGEYPIVKTKNELDGEWWGLYLKFKNNAVEVTWKKVPRSWFSKIWDAIVAVVSAIVKTIGQLFDFLGKVACALMKPAMMAAAAYITGGAALAPGSKPPTKPAGMSDEEYQMLLKGQKQLAKSGVKKSTLDKIKETGSNTLASQLADNVSAALCGQNTVPLPPETLGTPWYKKPTTWGIIGAGILVVGGGAYYYANKG